MEERTLPESAGADMGGASIVGVAGAGAGSPAEGGAAARAGRGSCASARAHASRTNLLNSSGLSRYT